jgi:DNA invertase Pin-like site-specific DNA recombinase
MKNTATPVVISYLRFSRPEQLKGDSIRRQLALGDEWAKRNGLKIADSFRDLGISAFRGKNAAEGNLSKLLALVDEGRIPAGSVLLIEQLDRLSRSALLEALELFLSIIRRGIKIVTLMDGQEYDRESLNRGMQQLMYSLMQMSLAHEESAKKSERLSHAWQAKRAKIKTRPLTRQLPAWLKVEGEKVVIDEAKAPTVRRIIQLALDGHGLGSITKKLNADATGLARVGYFNRSYVTKILKSRALIGEFQPHKVKYIGGKKRREPIGEPVKGYYPALITEDQFYAIQGQMSSRRLTGGPQAEFVNLFLGLMHDARDGSRMQIQDKGYGRRYVSSAALLGRKGASPYVGFPLDVFERAMLLQLHDLILPHLAKDTNDATRVQAAAMEARITEIEKKIADTQALMLTDSSVETASVVGLLAKLDQQRKRMNEELKTVRGELAARASLDLNDARDRLAELVRYYRKGEATLSNDDRVEIRNVIRQVIDRIDSTFERYKGRDYFARNQVMLRNGSVLSIDFTAEFQDRMLRDAKGHPIKGGAKGKPQFEVGMFEPRWMVFGSIDGKTALVAKTDEKVSHVVKVQK